MDIRSLTVNEHGHSANLDMSKSTNNDGTRLSDSLKRLSNKEMGIHQHKAPKSHKKAPYAGRLVQAPLAMLNGRKPLLCKNGHL